MSTSDLYYFLSDSRGFSVSGCVMANKGVKPLSGPKMPVCCQGLELVGLAVLSKVDVEAFLGQVRWRACQIKGHTERLDRDGPSPPAWLFGPVSL